MISVWVDEAYCFDMLSILELKMGNSDQDMLNYTQFLQNMVDQLGADLTRDIILSDEYRYLLGANQRVFDLIEQIMLGSDMSALTVHEANMERFVGKQKLQQAHFNRALLERKTV